MKRLIKYFLWIILASTVIVVAYVYITHWVLFFPNRNFEFHLQYKEFEVHADQPITENIKRQLDSVSIRMQPILDYDKGVYQIYLCNEPDKYEVFSNKAGKPLNSQGFNLQPLNHIFINISFAKEMQLRNKSGFKYHILEGSLSHLIAHEICHQLMADRIGFLRMRKVDRWKLEGYCEYAASKHLKKNDDSYQLENLVRDFLNGQFDHISAGRKFYIEALILTEYCLDNKSQSFIDFINDPIDKAELLQEIIRKNKEKRYDL